MAPFPTQPSQEPALEQFGIEPIGLCPSILPDNGRDPQVTEQWQKEQDEYFARKRRR
jgi:hypothetical protein